MNQAAQPIILDGARLARERAPSYAARAQAVARERGRPPCLLLVAFADLQGELRHVERKLRVCGQLGVDAEPLIISGGLATTEALDAMLAAIERGSWDGVFLQFPFPENIDGDALAAAIPLEADVDVMTPERIQRYVTNPDELPPVTVSAGLDLLSGYGLDIADKIGVVVADPNPFTIMFREALVRAGAVMQPLLAPQAQDLAGRLREAALVVVAVANPGAVRASDLPADAIAIDVGYFNPGGRGDIDTSTGVAHLAAIAMVPGGIGPMTISSLIERTILFAEHRASHGT